MNPQPLDLRNARSCIDTMVGYGTYRGHKIGIVEKEIAGMATWLKPGEVVLFRETEGRPNIVVERPYSPEQVAEQNDRGSLLTTYCTIVGVPREYVKEVLL